MTAPDGTVPARIVVTVQCGRCAGSYWLQCGERPDLLSAWGVQLAGLVLPMALSAGWMYAEDGTLRCPRCVEEHGLAPVERISWRKWLYGRSAPSCGPGTAPSQNEGGAGTQTRGGR